LEAAELHAYLQGAQGMLPGMMDDALLGTAMEDELPSIKPRWSWTELEAVLGMLQDLQLRLS